MFKTIHTISEYTSEIQSAKAALVYFSHEQCNVCKVLKPKVAELFVSEFPLVELCYVDMEKSPEIAGQNSIFAAPTLIIYFEGHESIRKSRNVNLSELATEVERPYNLLFS